MENNVRINKAISILGIASRRDADQLVERSRVYVNGTSAAIGQKIKNGDEIIVDGKSYIFRNDKSVKVWIYNKPTGIITSHKDQSGRQTVFDVVRQHVNERVVSVGRLDINSEGLLLLTNSGDFAGYAESPKTGWSRKYQVRIFGLLTDEILGQLRSGIKIDGTLYSSMSVNLIRKAGGKNCWIECVLYEGKNREIRKIFNYFGILVNKLIRVQYGPYYLGNLGLGEVKEVDAYRN
jgi:23S rRNA pseudouridine2605 synthase